MLESAPGSPRGVPRAAVKRSGRPVSSMRVRRIRAARKRSASTGSRLRRSTSRTPAVRAGWSSTSVSSSPEARAGERLVGDHVQVAVEHEKAATVKGQLDLPACGRCWSRSRGRGRWGARAGCVRDVGVCAGKVSIRGGGGQGPGHGSGSNPDGVRHTMGSGTAGDMPTSSTARRTPLLSQAAARNIDRRGKPRESQPEGGRRFTSQAGRCSGGTLDHLACRCTPYNSAVQDVITSK